LRLLLAARTAALDGSFHLPRGSAPIGIVSAADGAMEGAQGASRNHHTFAIRRVLFDGYFFVCDRDQLAMSDVFISYSHVDNEKGYGQDQGCHRL